MKPTMHDRFTTLRKCVAMTLHRAALLACCTILCATGCGQQSVKTPPATDDGKVSDSATTPQQTSEPNSTPTAKQESPDKADVADSKDSHVKEHEHGPGMGRGKGRGMGQGHGRRGGFRPDMTTIHAMFDDSDKIKRTITNLPNGAETLTESDDEHIAGLLQEHVPAMAGRVDNNEPLPPMTFHPLFTALIKGADKVDFKYEDTEKGIKVTYTSDDPQMVVVIQEHAKLVSRFLKNGMSEIHKPYVLPE